MMTVSRRAKDFKQPRGGFLRPSEFMKIPLEDNVSLNPSENIHPSIVGMTVDYLSRFTIGVNVEDAFAISLKGAREAERFLSAGCIRIAHNSLSKTKCLDIANNYLSKIKGLDDESITYACKLTSFDVWYRASNMVALNSSNYKEINPDSFTISNIRAMVIRSNSFFNTYGPVTKFGFNFNPGPKAIDQERGGYTATITGGDGDFLTADTLWDIKVSKESPSSKHTLQLLMYWRMGIHSGQDIYSGITRLGIFNPRLNIIHLLDISKIPEATIATVEKDVICY